MVAYLLATYVGIHAHRYVYIYIYMNVFLRRCIQVYTSARMYVCMSAYAFHDTPYRPQPRSNTKTAEGSEDWGLLALTLGQAWQGMWFGGLLGEKNVQGALITKHEVTKHEEWGSGPPKP